MSDYTAPTKSQDDSAGHTPGRWHWSLNEKHKQIELSNGNLTVMDFVRWGMQRATPRFREDVDHLNIMHPANKWGEIVAGREHHASWFKAINHPDARLIAAAPDLLESLRKLITEIDPRGSMTDTDLSHHRAVMEARAALLKAGVKL